MARQFVPRDTSLPMQNSENRRKQFHIWASQGATRFDCQDIVVRSIQAAAKEHKWSSEDVAPLLAELTADLNHVFGPLA